MADYFNRRVSMDEAYFNKITSYDKKFRDVLVAYFNNLPENIKIFIMTQERIAISQIKKHYDPDKQGEFYYAAFLKTVHQYRSIEIRSKKKGQFTKDELEFLDYLSMGKVYLKHKQKKKYKKDLIFKYESLILKLRRDTFSWKKISVYLRLNHHVNISACYLQRIFGDEKLRGLLDDQS